MSCNVDITYQEFRDRAINQEMIFPASKNSTRDDIAKWLIATNEYTRLQDAEYYLRDEDIRIAKKEERVSAIRNLIYKKFKVKDKYSLDSEIHSEGGTFIHELLYQANQVLADAYTNGTSLQEARKEALKKMKEVKGFEVIDDATYDKILQISEGVINQIIKTQAQINPNEKVLFFFENTVYDPTAKDFKAGTPDVLAIYSDKTFAHIDYKSVTPSGSRMKRKTEGGRTVNVFGKEPIEGIKFEGYRMPMNRYREILSKNYGLTEARQVELIPIVVNYEYNSQTKDFNKKITYIDSKFTAQDAETRELLASIPTSFQTTGNKKIDSTIKRLENLITTLDTKRSKVPRSSAEYESYSFKIKRIRKSILSLYNTSELDDYFSQLKMLFNLVYKENEDVFNLKPGEEGALSSEDLFYLNMEIEIYAHSLVDVVQEKIEVLKKSQPEDYKRYSDLYQAYISKLLILQNQVKDAIVKKGEQIKKAQGITINSLGEITMLDKNFKRFSDYDNWIFQTASSLIQEAIFKRNQKVNEFKKNLGEKLVAVKKAGFTYAQANNMLINPETGNLVQPYKRDFYDKTDADFKIKYYKPKENWREIYEEQKEKQVKYLREAVNTEKGIISDEAIEENFQKKLTFWESKNLLFINGEINPDAWTGEYSWKYLEINKDAAQAGGFVNQQYTTIQNNPALKAYYDFLTDFNKEAREILGVEWKEVSDYFLPWIRKSTADVLFDKTITMADKTRLINDDLFSSFKVMQDDTFNGEKDADGRPLMTIPKWFITPLLNDDGKVDVSMKSFDIAKTMELFADMVFNYETMSEIEADINILKSIILIEDQEIKRNGKSVLGKMMQTLEKKVSKGDTMYEVFDAITNSFLYGREIAGEDTIFKLGSKEISGTKALLSLNNYYVQKSLGLDPRIALANYLGPMILMRAQAAKGLAFNAKQNKQAHQIIAGAKVSKVFSTFEKDAKLIPFIMEFFQTHTERNVQLDAREFSQSFANKYVNADMLFKWMRDGETAVDTHLTLAMSMNYGYNKEGKFARLFNPDNTRRAGYEDYKSIYEILKEDFDTGSKFFESLPVNSLIKFRRAVMEQSKKLKGTMTYDDKAYFQTQMLMRLLMTFKTWMPGVIGDRMSKLKYNEKLDGTDWGRYSSLVAVNSYMAGDTVSGYLKEVLLPALGKFITETVVGVFPYYDIYKSERWKPLNEKRLKALYNKKKNESPDTFTRMIDGKEEVLISFEDFKNIVIQNQKATQAELRMVLGLFLLLLAMSASSGDDDEPMYKNSWEGRTMYRLVSRLYTELAFLYSPEEYLRLLGSSVPLIGLATDVKNIVENTLDETRDLLFGEDTKRDQTVPFYYSVKMIKGLNAFTKVYELFPQDVERER